MQIELGEIQEAFAHIVWEQPSCSCIRFSKL